MMRKIDNKDQRPQSHRAAFFLFGVAGCLAIAAAIHLQSPSPPATKKEARSHSRRQVALDGSDTPLDPMMQNDESLVSGDPARNNNTNSITDDGMSNNDTTAGNSPTPAWNQTDEVETLSSSASTPSSSVTVSIKLTDSPTWTPTMSPSWEPTMVPTWVPLMIPIQKRTPTPTLFPTPEIYNQQLDCPKVVVHRVVLAIDWRDTPEAQFPSNEDILNVIYNFYYDTWYNAYENYASSVLQTYDWSIEGTFLGTGVAFQSETRFAPCAPSREDYEFIFNEAIDYDLAKQLEAMSGLEVTATSLYSPFFDSWYLGDPVPRGWGFWCNFFGDTPGCEAPTRPPEPSYP